MSEILILAAITMFISLSCFILYFVISKEDEETLYKKYGVHDPDGFIAGGAFSLANSIILTVAWMALTG